MPQHGPVSIPRMQFFQVVVIGVEYLLESLLESVGCGAGEPEHGLFPRPLPTGLYPALAAEQGGAEPFFGTAPTLCPLMQH